MAGSTRMLTWETPTRRPFINFTVGVLLGFVLTHVGLKLYDLGIVDKFHVSVLDRKSSLLLTNNHGDEDQAEAEANDDAEGSHGRITNSDYIVLGKDALSHWMSQKIRILCWIMTHPGNLQTKAIHVNATWVKRCSTVLFMSSENTDFPTIAVVDHEGRDHLWRKTRGAFEYISKHYLDKADWFLKADDDTYVIMENVRKLVSLYDPEKPIFFGRRFKSFGRKYTSGGAGYVLSRKAVKLLTEDAFKDTKLCKSATHVGYPEDVEIGRCLKNVGVETGDSRTDIYETFHPFIPEHMLVPSSLLKKYRWYYSLNFYPVQKGPKCCSDYSISFHYVTPDMMYWLEYMVYQMRPFGVGYHTCPSNIRTMIGPPS